MKKLIFILAISMIAACTSDFDVEPQNVFAYKGTPLSSCELYIIKHDDITTRTANSFGLNKPAGFYNPTKTQMEFWAAKQHLYELVFVFAGPGVTVGSDQGVYNGITGTGDLIIFKAWVNKSGQLSGDYDISVMVQEFNANNLKLFRSTYSPTTPRVYEAAVQAGIISIIQTGNSYTVKTTQDISIDYSGTPVVLDDTNLKI